MPLDTNPIIARLIFWVILFFVLVVPHFFLSRITKIEHDNFHDQWEKDGRPHGMPYWFPWGELHLMGFRSHSGLMGLLWLFKKPNWVMGHPDACKFLKYYRITMYISFSIMFSVCLLVVLTSP